MVPNCTVFLLALLFVYPVYCFQYYYVICRYSIFILSISLVQFGEGNGTPLQYSWASLVAQLVKNPPAMRETWDRSLGWEDRLEKGKATHSGILA